MTYQEALEKFSEQLSFEPQVKYQENIKAYKNILVLGMGGSRLAPDFIKLFHPELDIPVHYDYNLPN